MVREIVPNIEKLKLVVLNMIFLNFFASIQLAGGMMMKPSIHLEMINESFYQHVVVVVDVAYFDRQ